LFSSHDRKLKKKVFQTVLKQFYFILYFYFTPSQHSKVDGILVKRQWSYDEWDEVVWGGISCLKNNSRQPLQERKTISKL
jgi:hypothetical protein